MSLPVFADFFARTSQLAAGDLFVRPTSIDGTPTGSDIATGLDGTTFHGTAPDGTALLELHSTSLGRINTQPACRGAVGGDGNSFTFDDEATTLG